MTKVDSSPPGRGTGMLVLVGAVVMGSGWFGCSQGLIVHPQRCGRVVRGDDIVLMGCQCCHFAAWLGWLSRWSFSRDGVADKA